jgi:acyl-CoA dehydrogenase
MSAGARERGIGPELTGQIADKVEAFVRNVVAPYEKDPRRDHHDCPTEELIAELKAKARDAGVLTPHILPDGRHLSLRETAIVLAEIRSVTAWTARPLLMPDKAGASVPLR